MKILYRLKQEVESARLNAALTVNKQMLVLYWRIGKNILDQQKSEGWGAKVIDRLATDLRKAFPHMKGFSPRNLKYMRAFAEAYPSFVQDPLAQIASDTFVQAQITWYHHITLLDKVQDEHARIFYISKAAENGWSRNVMVHQLESKLYERQGKAVTNFSNTLPVQQSDLAKEILKDPYKFDFLSLTEEYLEKDLEEELVSHITKFFLELGAGFSYVGRHYRVEVGGKEFEIDLLFYHLQLRCFVVVELKKGEFVPEHAGKLNFYLNAVDDLLKHETDSPSIGILICKERNRVVAEYALANRYSTI